MTAPNERDREFIERLYDAVSRLKHGCCEDENVNLPERLLADYRLTLEREMRELGPCGHPKLFLEIDSHGEGETAVSFVMGCPFCRELAQKNRLERTALLHWASRKFKQFWLSLCDLEPSVQYLGPTADKLANEIVGDLNASDFSSLDAYVAEAVRKGRLEEVKMIPVHIWPQSVGEQRSWNMHRTIRIEALKAAEGTQEKKI